MGKTNSFSASTNADDVEKYTPDHSLRLKQAGNSAEEEIGDAAEGWRDKEGDQLSSHSM